MHLADEFELWLRGIEGDYVAQRNNIVSGFLASSPLWPSCPVEALQDASHEDGFWFRLSSPSLQQVLRVISPLNDVVLDHHDFLEVCLLISNIVDKYSSFTQTHSTSVAHVAAKLAELYGCDRYTQIKSASRVPARYWQAGYSTGNPREAGKAGAGRVCANEAPQL